MPFVILEENKGNVACVATPVCGEFVRMSRVRTVSSRAGEFFAEHTPCLLNGRYCMCDVLTHRQGAFLEFDASACFATEPAMVRFPQVGERWKRSKTC